VGAGGLILGLLMLPSCCCCVLPSCVQVVTLQGLGPCGWFDVATCDKFELSEEEMVSPDVLPAVLVVDSRQGAPELEP